MVKISLQNSWIPIVIQVSIKIEWFVASETDRRQTAILLNALA